MLIISIVETMFDCTICNRQLKGQTGAKLHMKVKQRKVMHHMHMQSALSLKGRIRSFPQPFFLFFDGMLNL